MQIGMVSYDELAEIIGVRKSTLYAWVARRKIPFVKISPRCTMFKISDIEEWIQGKRVLPIEDDLCDECALKEPSDWN